MGAVVRGALLPPPDRAPAPEAVGFDYGGTLVRVAVPEAALRAAGEALAQDLSDLAGSWSGTPGDLLMDFSATVDEEARAAHRRRPLREVDPRALEERALGRLLGREPPPGLARMLGAAAQQAWISGVVVAEEARQLLLRLRERGLRLGLLSNAPYPPQAMRLQLARLGLLQHFEVALFSTDLGWRKPAPEAFQGLLERLDLAPGAVWFVGDEVEADLLGARAAGMRAFLAPGPGAGEGAHRLASWGRLLELLDDASGAGGRLADRP